MKTAIQIILLTWFIVVNLLIIGPSFYLLLQQPTVATAEQPKVPSPPGDVTLASLDPALDIEKQKQQVEAYKQQVAAYTERVKVYTQQVAAYGQQVTAYKTLQDAQPSTRRAAIFELVVKGTLVTLISGFATALIAYVFTNLGATVIDNFVRMRNNQAPQPLKVL
jgi:hypothetical protein